MPTTCGASPPRPRGGRPEARGVPGGAPSDQLSRTPRGPTARLFHKQERLAAGQAGEAPGTAPPCGAALPQWLRCLPRPRVAATERSNERGVAALRPSAWRRKAAPVLRADAWRRSVGQPLLGDNPALGPQTFTRDTGPRGPTVRCAGARRRMVAQDIEHGVAPREPIASAIPVREGQREAQAPAQGDVHVRRGRRGSRGSRHSGKPSPRMGAKLRAEKLPTVRPIAWFTVSRYSGRGRARRDVLPGRTLDPAALEQVASDASRGGSFVVCEELPHIAPLHQDDAGRQGAARVAQETKACGGHPAKRRRAASVAP